MYLPVIILMIAFFLFINFLRTPLRPGRYTYGRKYAVPLLCLIIALLSLGAIIAKLSSNHRTIKQHEIYSVSSYVGRIYTELSMEDDIISEFIREFNKTNILQTTNFNYPEDDYIEDSYDDNNQLIVLYKYTQKKLQNGKVTSDVVNMSVDFFISQHENGDVYVSRSAGGGFITLYHKYWIENDRLGEMLLEILSG